LENRYFKVTFDRAGNVTNILDKQHGNKEIVDTEAPQPLNQYVLYKDGALAGEVATATLAASTGPVLGCMTADGVATGLDSLRRKVVLYEALPRIDIINDAVKGQQIARVEMGYFAFPLKVDNFMLRHQRSKHRAVFHFLHRLLHRQPLDRCLQPMRLGSHLRRTQRPVGFLWQARHRDVQRWMGCQL
jgi:hypothetical protein